VQLLGAEQLAVAAGAADAINLCTTFIDARIVITNAGALPALQDLKRRADSEPEKPMANHAAETSKMLLDALSPSEGLKGAQSPLYNRLNELYGV